MKHILSCFLETIFLFQSDLNRKISSHQKCLIRHFTLYKIDGSYTLAVVETV